MFVDRLKSVCSMDCDVQDVIGGEGSQSVRYNFFIRISIMGVEEFYGN